MTQSTPDVSEAMLSSADIMALSKRLGPQSFNVVAVNSSRVAAGYYSIAGTIGRLREEAIQTEDPQKKAELLAAVQEVQTVWKEEGSLTVKELDRLSWWTKVFAGSVVFLAFALLLRGWQEKKILKAMR